MSRDPRCGARPVGDRAALLARPIALAALAATLVLTGVEATTPDDVQAQATWRLEQPDPPEGAPFRVPLGQPGDLQFLSRNRGLLGVEGNDTIPRGIYSYNGERWRQLSTVCGGPGDTMRIAFAGPSSPTEFWTVTEPSRPRFGSGTSLCRFRGGEVIASYSTPPESSDPFRTMLSATCNGPDDCWFGGVGSQDALGERVGAFHLHWNGTALETVYGPQGRGVSDVEAHNGRIYESTYVGRGPGNRDDPVELAEPEDEPRLIHTIAGGNFANDPFVPAQRTGVPEDGTELLGLDGDGSQLWAVGGGAASGPSAPTTQDGSGRSVARPPIAARLNGTVFQEVDLIDPLGDLEDDERFTDVAAIPGTSSAFATVVPFGEARSSNSRAEVAMIDADGTFTTQRLPVGGSGRGAAAKIACPAPNDCWMATHAGWLFHYTDGTRPPRDDDPAFNRTITFRPNEAAEQFVPDTPPEDDSRLFAPPPVELETEAEVDEGNNVRRLPPLLRRIKTRRRGLTLIVSFTVVRRARVQLLGKRGRRTVARTKPRVLGRGRRTLRLRVTRKRYPTRLQFRARGVGAPRAGAPAGVGAGSVTSTASRSR